MGFRDRPGRRLGSPLAGALDPDDPGALRARDARERHRRHGLLSRVLVPAAHRGAAPGSGAEASPSLRRRRLRGDRVDQRRARREPRGRLHLLHRRHHGIPRRVGRARDRGARGRRPDGSRQAAGQTGLAAPPALDLVSPDDGDLADGVARARALELDRGDPLDAEPGTLGDRAGSSPRRKAARGPLAVGETPREQCPSRRRQLSGHRGGSPPPDRALRPGDRRLQERASPEPGASSVDRRGAPALGGTRRPHRLRSQLHGHPLHRGAGRPASVERTAL